MRKSRITATILSLICLFSTCVSALASKTERKVIAQEDFSSGMSGWNNTVKKDFYVLNERLNVKSTNKALASIVSDRIFTDNGELEFDMNITEGEYFSTYLRYQDDGTYYELRFYPKRGRVVLFKKVNSGLLTEVKTGYCTIELEINLRVHVTLLKDEFKVYINDTLVLNAEDKSISSGKLGFGGAGAKAYVDNIVLYKNVGIDYDAVDSTDIVETRKIYVSVKGSDTSGDGSEQKPYASVEKAKDMVARLKNGKTPIEVIFKEGIYRLDSSLAFTEKDSGTADAPITYKAAEGEDVIFSGAKEVDISKFEAVSEEKQGRLKMNVRDKVLQIDLGKQGFKRETYDWTDSSRWPVGQRIKVLNVSLNHKLQNVARWPNSGYEVITDCDNTNPPKIFYEESNPSRWAEAKNFFIDGYLMHDWAPEWALVDSVDVLTNSINFKNKTSYGVRVGGKWAAANLLEELDVAGEWYIDFDTMMMYYYPPHELGENDILEIAHVINSLVSMNGVSHLKFDGIHFTMNQGGGGTGINITNGSNNLVFQNCIVDNVARHGIQIQGNDITIDNCIINNTGESGVHISECGNADTLESGNIVVKNCDISTPSIYAGGNGTGCVTTGEYTVGVEVVNNVFHNVSNSAIRYMGTGHHFAYNEIYNAVNEASDAGAIYSGRSWTFYGNVAEYNFFHDIGQLVNTTAYTASSIFWDDYNSGGEFSHNINYINNKKKTAGVLLGGGSDNIVKGNTVISADKAIIANDRGEKDWNDYGHKTLRYDILPVTSAPYMEKYPKAATIFERIAENGGVWKRENIITDNLGVDIVNEQGSTYTEAVIEGGTIERNVHIDADYNEIFVNPDDLDFRVKKSAKEKYGISDEILDEDFDIDSIGRQGKPEIPMDRMEIEAIYPENGDNTVDPSRTVLVWTAAPIADYYDVVLSDDPEFKTTILNTRILKTSIEIENLEPGKTYYWKVKSVNASRQYGCESEAKGGVMSFTMAKDAELDMSGLKMSVSNAERTIKKLKEGTEPGEYRIGSVSAVQAKINKGKSMLNKKVGLQKEIDTIAYEINRTLTNLEGFINPGYTTLNLTEKSPWVTNKPDTTTFTAKDGYVKVDLTKSAEITLNETLSNYNIMCFKTKVDNFADKAWFAYGLRALDPYAAIYTQDAYYILIKEDVFELQKKGVIYKTAPNNGKFKAGQWHDLEFGSITTENGINMLFKIDGEVIFDYLDKTNPQRRPGAFAMFFSSVQPNSVEIMDAETVPSGVYQFSDEILKEISQDASAGDVIGTNSDTYSEKGNWSDKAAAFGDKESQVRTTTDANAFAKWEMNTGSSGNGKLYKLYYYHIPKENGDKKVNVLVSGYGGEYETTIDLSQGEEGYVELGTFMFIAADYVGRLTVTFTGSGEGELNVSNVKFEHTADGENMLK